MNPLALQTAVYQALQGPLDGFLARQRFVDGTTGTNPAVYDHVPQQVDEDDDHPYVTIGDDTSVDFDTDDSVGSEATMTLHAWSRFRGRSEVKNILRAIYTALHRKELVVGDKHTVDCIFEYSETLLDQDGITRHGVIRFRITTEEV